MGNRVTLADDEVIFSFSPHNAAVIEVDSGDTLVVETRDSYDHRFEANQDVDSYVEDRSKLRSNPATGPIYVRGVRPGDGLNVTIEKIELGPTGFVAAVPGIGVLGDTGIIPRISAFNVKPDGLWFEDKLRLPLRPMVGVIGVAPAVDDISTGEIGPHGGNLDCKDITEGTTLHFPVWVEGSLLAVGDAHASMGAGELHSGVNINAKVTFRIERISFPSWHRLWFESATEIMIPGIGDTVEEAIRQATQGMVDLLVERLSISHTEAVILAGASCDMRLGQASKFGIKVSVYAVMTKEVFNQPR